uniref:OJ000315_02.6 protein n=1 Tax=Oryza sativa subsp. japonica TaxID=39947 RepID=Q7F8W5_ORYSJ|nr:OJ000315_02.6 [Oryza sativa Japonica Group]
MERAARRGSSGGTGLGGAARHGARGDDGDGSAVATGRCAVRWDGATGWRRATRGGTAVAAVRGARRWTAARRRDGNDGDGGAGLGAARCGDGDGVGRGEAERRAGREGNAAKEGLGLGDLVEHFRVYS